MPAPDANTRFGGRNFFAKFATYLARILHRAAARHGPPPPVSDRMVRDMGLDPAEVARTRIVWPSQQPGHPRL